MSESDKVATDRRGFLKFAGLGTVAGGAALVTGATTDTAEAAGAPRGNGYQETDHVKTFYDTARF